MLVASSSPQDDTCKQNVVGTSEWQAFWRGFVYLEGARAGQESVLRFLRAGPGNLASTSAQLKGTYFMVLLHRQSGVRYAFIDPSGLYHAFYANWGAGASFLELAASHFGVGDISPESLVEFLHYGHFSFGATFFSPIRRIAPEHVLRISDGRIEIVPRTLSDLETRPSRSFEECFASFVASVGHEKISLDLTGGIDSRLLLVLSQYFGLPVETALSGTLENEDIALAELVAKAVGCELHVTRHDIDQWETLLPELFVACDGVFDVLRAHRPYQLHKARRDRGISLALSGAGGELFKDFWWLQDFPWYRRRKPNLLRLFETRIAPVEPRHDYLAKAYRGISRQYAAKFCEKLTRYAVEGNTRTYDRIYYECKMRDYAGRFLTNHNHLLSCHAPYLDRELVAIGYNLPRHLRAFNTFHRQMITRYNPLVARIATTEGGMSVSSSWARIMADLPKYVGDKLMRLERKISQHVLHSSRPLKSPNDPQLWVRARSLLHSRKTLDRLKDYGFISAAIQLDELEAGYVGNLLSLDLLCERLEAGRNAAPIEQLSYVS